MKLKSLLVSLGFLTVTLFTHAQDGDNAWQDSRWRVGLNFDRNFGKAEQDFGTRYISNGNGSFTEEAICESLGQGYDAGVGIDYQICRKAYAGVGIEYLLGDKIETDYTETPTTTSVETMWTRAWKVKPRVGFNLPLSKNSDRFFLDLNTGLVIIPGSTTRTRYESNSEDSFSFTSIEEESLKETKNNLGFGMYGELGAYFNIGSIYAGVYTGLETFSLKTKSSEVTEYSRVTTVTGLPPQEQTLDDWNTADIEANYHTTLDENSNTFSNPDFDQDQPRDELVMKTQHSNASFGFRVGFRF